MKPSESPMQLKYFATFRDITRCKAEDIPAPSNVLALLHYLCERYAGFRPKLLAPDGTDAGEETIILVNGRNISHLDGVATPLAEADKVSIFPVVAGG